MFSVIGVWRIDANLYSIIIFLATLLLDPWSLWIPRIIEIRCIGLFLTSTFCMTIDKSIAWGKQESTSPLNTFTIQHKIFRGGIDLVFATIDVRKLKETATQRYWRQWGSLLFLFFFLLTFGIGQPLPHPTPKFNCSDRVLSSASVYKEEQIFIEHILQHKTLYEKLYVTF